MIDALETAQRADVVAEARRWLGTPYHHAGRLLEVGVDCAQLPAAVYHAAGLIPVIPLIDYRPDWHMHRSQERYLAEVLQHAHEIETPPQPGDFLLWRVGHCLAHGAIVVDYPLIIHAVSRIGVTLGDAERDCLCPRHRLARMERHTYTLWGGR